MHRPSRAAATGNPVEHLRLSRRRLRRGTEMGPPATGSRVLDRRTQGTTAPLAEGQRSRALRQQVPAPRLSISPQPDCCSLPTAARTRKGGAKALQKTCCCTLPPCCALPGEGSLSTSLRPSCTPPRPRPSQPVQHRCRRKRQRGSRAPCTEP